MTAYGPKLYCLILVFCLAAPSLSSAASQTSTPVFSLPAQGKKAPTFEGEILKKKGKKVVIKLSATTLPKVGAKGELLKFFKKFMFSGWLNIAEVKVVRVKGQKVVLKILKKKSKMKVNGKKVRHFKKGVRVKLTLR
jgi:hypothetical protein